MHGVDPTLAEESVAAAAARVRVVDFFYSNPDPALVDIVHRAGALACWQVGSLDEALAAVDAGCDFIIAQGAGAGGHVRGTVPLLPLLDEVLEAVDVPVLAAGGIGSGRAMAAVMAAGADGVRVGTRFIAAEEPEAHPIYVEALTAAQAQDTVITQAFNGDWPVEYEAVRVLRSSLEAAQAFEGEIVGEYENPWTGERYTMRRLRCDTITKAATGNIEAMPHFAGEGVGSVKQVQTAAEIIEELVDEAETLLRRWR
jgi:NAD(P)H-dependent flavin oxidoreductase YrpB (nitropropane dioxygenase family)